MVTGDYASFPPRLRELRHRLLSFMEEHVLPAEGLLGGEEAKGNQRWMPRPLMEELKVRDMVLVVQIPLNKSTGACIQEKPYLRLG